MVTALTLSDVDPLGWALAGSTLAYSVLVGWACQRMWRIGAEADRRRRQAERDERGDQ